MEKKLSAFSNILEHAWPIFAVLAALAGSACGPIAPSVGKASLTAASGGAAAIPAIGLFSGDASQLHSEASTENLTVNAAQTRFVGVVPMVLTATTATLRQSPLTTMLRQDYASVVRSRQVTFTPEMLEDFRESAGEIEMPLVQSEFPELTDQARIHVVVELNRPNDRIPSENFLPRASVTQVTDTASEDQSRILKVRFSHVTDPAAETLESLARDVRRVIVISID